ncbi:MAG: hypothetical protein KTR28_03635 [Micavibrio sp.]|nr:hypothetical protein [Micavibrio sp.]
MKHLNTLLLCVICMAPTYAQAEEPQFNFYSSANNLYYNASDKALALPFADDGDNTRVEMYLKNNEGHPYDAEDQYQKNKFNPMIGVKFRLKLN